MTAADALLAEDAPAKVNLSLHLCGRRPDGYHLLDSLVVFPRIGDRLAAAPAAALLLTLSGPVAVALSDQPDNLVLRAARALSAYHGVRTGAALDLEKNLPVASGIGGGSSDAAAALRVLSRLWRVPVPPHLALRLGADVPVCLTAPTPCRMSGIGEVLSPAPPMPEFWMVLVNPGVEVATGAVFAAIETADMPPAPSPPATGFADFAALCDWLATQRNDLQPAAARLCPPIPAVLAALADAPLARMSGSGATCFALFPDEAGARACAARLTGTPGWWVAAAPVTAGDH